MNHARRLNKLESRKSLFTSNFIHIKSNFYLNLVFRFPISRPEVLKEWIKFVNKDKSWTPSKFNSICSKHFLQNDYSHGTRRKFLKTQAIPSSYNQMQKSPEISIASSIADSEDVGIDYIDVPENLDICGLCGVEDQFKNDLNENMDLIKKVLPNLMIAPKNISKKICMDCYSKLQLYEKFMDKVTKTQEEDERIMVPPSVQEKVRIKQEPIHESSCEDDTPQVSPQKPSSKKCEILEVVDVTSADLKQYDKMFQSVFLQCETLKSDVKVSMSKTLKIEELSEEDESDSCLEPSLLRNYGNNINLFKDHTYNKLDIENSGLWLKKEEK